MSGAFDQVVTAFEDGRSRTVGGLTGVTDRVLEELVDAAAKELKKRLSREKWTQRDLDRLACAFVVLAYKSELGDEPEDDEEEEDDDD